MRFVYNFYFLLAFTVFACWFNYRLIGRLGPFWRTRPARFTYLAFTAATLLLVLTGWPRQPSLDAFGQDFYQFLVYVALVWLLGQLVLLALQPILYLARRLLARGSPVDPAPLAAPGLTRRAFLQGALAAAPLLAFGVTARGVYGAQTDLAVVRHTLTLPGLPAGLDGFKIAQISDTHVGPYFDLDRLDEILAATEREKPDLAVLTGDFVDDLSLLEPAVARLAALHAALPRGLYFCWGNHEYFRDIGLIRRALGAAGIPILANSAALILPGERPFYLLGADYPTGDTGRRGLQVSSDRRREYYAATSRGLPASAFKILIAHHPDFLIDGFAAGIPLTLTGHTHGGQVVIAGRPLISLHPYIRGLYSENGVYGYVSSGAGHWFPFRHGCPPEISTFTLKA